MSKVKFTEFTKKSNWVYGEHEDGYGFAAKLFDEGSVFGINEGRVSKLTIVNDSDDYIANYDRGWDMEPETEKHQEVFEEILEFLEKAPKRFSENEE